MDSPINNSNKIKLSEKYKHDGIVVDAVAKTTNGQSVPPTTNIPPQKKTFFQSDRQPFIKLYVAETGCGKTYGIIQECKGYIKDNLITGKKGRPSVIFDPNLEAAYNDAFPIVIKKEQVKFITKPGAYRVLPINAKGKMMVDEEKREVAIYLANNCFDCLLVLDDIDTYFKGAKPREMDKLFLAYRHSGLDIIFTHQFLNPISPQEWNACKILSLRKTVHSVETIADRVPNPEILYIAENQVWEMYDLADEMFRKGRITEDEYKIHKSFFVDVDIRTNKIIGAYSKKSFIRNCIKYLNMNPRIISDYQKINCDDEGRIVINRSEAMDKIINKKLWRYFAGRE